MTASLSARQIVEPRANEASGERRAEKRLVSAKREAVRARILLDKTETQLVGMWRKLEPMLEDFTQAETIVDRDSARRRIQTLRWEMQSLDATVTASREVAPRAAWRIATVTGWRD